MIVIKRAQSDSEMQACFSIRNQVFVGEQNVPAEMELDDYDGDSNTVHFLVLDAGRPVGTARVLLKDNGRTAKIGRVAIAAASRGSGLGARLMMDIEAAPEMAGVHTFKLDAQTHALAFYQRLGYVASGEEFMDAGIAHFHMEKQRR
jgi:predicted GNAT family N-acyltransferase